MATVTMLADFGIAPALKVSADEMRDGLWKVIDAAVDKGMPIGLIIGQLEVMKAAMIDAHFRKNMGE